MLDPVVVFCFVFFFTSNFLSHQSLWCRFSNAWRRCSCQCCHSCSGVSSVLTFMTPPPAYCTNRRSPETQTDNDGPAQLEGKKNKTIRIIVDKVRLPTGRRHSDVFLRNTAGIRYDSCFTDAPVSTSALLEKPARSESEIELAWGLTWRHRKS